MTWILDIIKSWRSWLFAFVGVLAVAGVSAGIMSYLYIQGQNKRIEDKNEIIALQAQTNDQWSKNWDSMKAKQQLDQQSMLDLQAQLETIAADNEGLAAGIKKLEATSAETRDYLRSRIPDDLRRLLEQK